MHKIAMSANSSEWGVGDQVLTLLTVGTRKFTCNTAQYYIQIKIII